MRIENVDREVVTHDDPSSFDVASAETAAVGELRLTFVWTEFLEEDGENLVLGDALTTSDGGTWLLSLEDRQTLGGDAGRVLRHRDAEHGRGTAFRRRRHHRGAPDVRGEAIP